jgi:hypothetical protein
MDFATLQMIFGITISIGTVITLVASGVKWLVKHYFDDIKKELKPNSGSSLKDQVTRLEKEMAQAEALRKEMNTKIDHMYEILLDFVSKK